MSEPRATTSCSNFYRRVKCPASERAECYAPAESSKQAETGVLLHYKDAFGMDGTEDQSEEWLLTKSAELRDKFIAEQLKALKIPLDAKRIEVKDTSRLYMRDENGNVLIGIDGLPFSGQPDRLVYFEEHKLLFIFDLKTGRLAVPSAQENFQLRSYCCLCSDEWGEYESDKVIAAIVQPYCSPSLSATLYTKKEIAIAKKEILSAWYACKSPDAPFNPSLDCCYFCRARYNCEANKPMMREMALTKISDIPIPELEAMAEKVALCEAVCDGYWKRIRTILDTAPELLSRFELKSTGSLKAIKPENLDKARIVLASEGLLTDEQFKLAAKVSVPELGKLSGDRAKVEQVLTNHGLLEVTEKKPTIAEKKQPKLKC